MENLITHQMLHNGVKDFECGQCNKAFRWRNDLISHQQIHTGVMEL